MKTEVIQEFIYPSGPEKGARFETENTGVTNYHRARVTADHKNIQLDTLTEVSEFDGFVVSLIVCPELIPPSEWLPVVLGTEEGLDFDSMKDAQTTIDAMMGHYNIVAHDLAKFESDYECILETDTITGETLWEPWIAGFERGMRMRHQSWEVMVESDDKEVSSILPMILALNDIDTGKAMPPASN